MFYKYLPMDGDLPSGETCLSGMETYRILLKRQGGREFLANDSEKAFRGQSEQAEPPTKPKPMRSSATFQSLIPSSMKLDFALAR